MFKKGRCDRAGEPLTDRNSYGWAASASLASVVVWSLGAPSTVPQQSLNSPSTVPQQSLNSPLTEPLRSIAVPHAPAYIYLLFVCSRFTFLPTSLPSLYFWKSYFRNVHIGFLTHMGGEGLAGGLVGGRSCSLAAGRSAVRKLHGSDGPCLACLALLGRGLRVTVCAWSVSVWVGPR